MAYINLGQVIYPVGAIYASANSTSPASLFGGSWTQITNAALRGATNVGYTGSDTHTLTIQEMPSHSHSSVTGHQIMTYEYPNGNCVDGIKYGGNWCAGKNSTVQNTGGGGQHTPTCNAPTTVICGNVQAKSPRGDAA